MRSCFCLCHPRCFQDPALCRPLHGPCWPSRTPAAVYTFACYIPPLSRCRTVNLHVSLNLHLIQYYSLQYKGCRDGRSVPLYLSVHPTSAGKVCSTARDTPTPRRHRPVCRDTVSHLDPSITWGSHLSRSAICLGGGGPISPLGPTMLRLLLWTDPPPTACPPTFFHDFLIVAIFPA